MRIRYVVTLQEDCYIFPPGSGFPVNLPICNFYHRQGGNKPVTFGPVSMDPQQDDDMGQRLQLDYHKTVYRVQMWALVVV